ncbi:uncharacterized protein LOC142326933 [Lycorma delicatula]|uniref:uncharacterized protein LOC142326933 n=1 Tax=Lycorma delicatula TaxID=130591 RepID=UPI003F512E22
MVDMSAFTVKKHLLTFLWVHEHPHTGKTMENIMNDFFDKPYFFMDESGNYTGYLFDVLKELESSLNFTVMLTAMKNINDISALKQHDIQLKLYSTFSNKSENIIKSFPVIFLRPKLYYCRPKQINYWQEYINVFNNNSWIVITTTFILLSIILNTASKIITTVYEDEEIDMNTSIFFIYTAVVQQNAVINTNSQGIKLIIWSTFITSIFILTIYTADFTSDLTYTKVKVAANTLDDIMNKELQVIIIKNSLPHLLIQNFQ